MNRDTLQNLGLLVLRAGTGLLLLYGHGWGKFIHFSERAGRFSDPLGIGSPASLALVIFAEVICSTLLVVGFLTRFAAVPIVAFTAVAVFIHHAADPWPRKEAALLFMVPAIAIALLGPGRFSVDARAFGGRRGGK